MTPQKTLHFIFAACVALSVGCSGVDEVGSGRRPSVRDAKDLSAVAPVEPMPWEIWQPFYDLQNNKLSNAALILGDELLKKGKRRAALDSYLKAQKVKLEDSEAEAVALRIASQHLALDQSARALAAISSHFKARGLGEADVSTPFALLLAYAYGRHGDREQSLAWFSKTHRQAQSGERVGAQAAETGATLLLRTVAQSDFEGVALDWSSDPFINQLIGRERMRRAQSNGRVFDDLRRPFWQGAVSSIVAADLAIPQVAKDVRVPVVGVLLSLSDKFGSLGRDTKQGLELAIEADREQPKAKIAVRDVGSDPASAAAAVRELVVTSSPSVIVGPLLTDVSVSAADTAREVRVPMISFSKSENFAIGDGVTRLGATTTSQIEALMGAAYSDLGLTQFAIAYPNTAHGHEVLQIFKKKLASLGLSPVLEAPYASTDEVSILEVAQRLDSAGAQALLIPDSVEISVKLLSNISPATRKKLRPLGTALWDNPSKIANSQALFNSAIFVTPFFPQSSRSVVQQFSDSYKGKYRSAPNFLAAQGFDVGTLVVAAMHKSLNDKINFTDALAQLPRYEGVTGLIEMQRSGEIKRSFYVVEVSSSGFVERFPGASVGKPQELQNADDRVVRTAPSFLKDEERVASGY